MRFAVLGPLQVTSAGELTPERPSHRRLLSILLLERGQPLDVDRLIDRFWPEQPPATAKAALQTHVSELRRHLGPEVIRTRTEGYVLTLDDHELDLHEFAAAGSAARDAHRSARWEDVIEASERALRLWRGRPFPELEDDDFARPEMVRLDELHLEMIELRAEARLELGQTQEALTDLEPVTLEHPLRERLWELLMTARARAGRTADALRAYHDLREILDEMGLEPGPALRDLEARILREDAALVPSPVRHNLPTQLTTFLGREEELSELTAVLGDHRLVTLTGAGGSGKTRLAQEVAGHVVDRFRDGVWVVDLAPLSDPELVASTVAATVGLGAEDRSAVEALRAGLPQRSLLCVLDNCEHLVEPVSALAADMLEAGPGVHIVATSREALGLPGEVVFDVRPLAVPPVDLGEAAIPATSPAVELFVDRARLVSRRFTVDADTGPAVAEICRRVDGLPLAIELVASRMGALTPQLVAERLAEGYALASVPRGSSARHQALEAAISWSYELLSEPEQRLFTRLAVFSGGFTADAVDAVCVGEGDDAAEALHLLTRLVEQSLVVHEEVDSPESGRYRLLETLRHFARGRLEESGTADEVRRRHRDWFHRLAEQAEEHVEDLDERAWLERLDIEHGNLETALEWTLAAGEPQPVSVLAAAVARRWTDRGQYRLAIDRLRLALETATDARRAWTAELRRRLAIHLFHGGDPDAAVREAEQARALVADAPPTPETVRVLATCARLLRMHIGRDPTEAIALAREAAAAAEETGDPLVETRALVDLGSALGWAGIVEEGLGHLRTAHGRARDLRHPATIVRTNVSLVMLLYLEGSPGWEEQRRLADEVISLAEQGQWSWADDGVPDWLVYVLLHAGEWQQAEDLIGHMSSRHLEGYDQVSLHMVRGTLRWMQGRLGEAESDLASLRHAGVHERWYHDFYPLAADVAAAQGRISEVRRLAEEHLAVQPDSSEEPMKLGTLRPLVAAEVDAALASDGATRQAHVHRAREALARMGDLLERFPPVTAGSLQLETPVGYLRLAEAELSRVTGPDPERWTAALSRTRYAYWRLYARWRRAEALSAAGRGDDAQAEARQALEQACALGSWHLHEQVAALAAHQR